MATQARTAQISNPPQSSSMARQAIINGNFDVWQRGTSFTPATGDYTADRWRVSYDADGGTLPTDTIDRIKQAVVNIPNSYFNLRLNVDGAGSSLGSDSFYDIYQRIEFGTRSLCGDGKTVTVSFWARSDITDKKLGVYARQYYGTGGSPTSTEVINGTAWTLTSTWTKYTHTFTTNTLSGKTFGTNDNDWLELRFSAMWGDNKDTEVGETTAEDFGGSGDIYIAQVQLCAGSEVLPFEPKSAPQELRDCQRYCYAVAYPIASLDARTKLGTAIAYSTTAANVLVELPVSMRGEPTLTWTATDWSLQDPSTSYYELTSGSIAPANSNKTLFINVNVASGLTIDQVYWFTSDATAGRLMYFEAEL